jgi:hypothetical protein
VSVVAGRLGAMHWVEERDGDWVGECVRDAELRQVYADVAELADWSPWASFAAGVAQAPRLPGVYLFREPGSQVVRYVAMAGERAGSGRPRGLHGRLSVYLSGQEPVSGFAEAALDRALGDEAWVEQQVRRSRAEGGRPAKRWAADAIARLAPDVTWASCHERADARYLESEVELLLRPFGLWKH